VRKSEITKARLLDAAEALFAEVGFDAVSMRDVASRSGVLLGLITYHFGTKEALFEEVIGRRAAELNRRREKELDALRNPTIEAVLDAFLHPYSELMRDGGAGWKSYGRLIAHIGQSERWAELSARHFSSVGHRVIDCLMQAEPTLTREKAAYGYVHLVSVMFGVFSTSGLLDIFSDGAMHSSDLSAAYPSMLAFVAGGIRALAASREVSRIARAARRRGGERSARSVRPLARRK
jgi:AcrR family transcriptional regulator